MSPRKYYHHVERHPQNIKSVWKVLHVSTFLLIILNSLISAYQFGDLLKMFNYRCILHVEPYFDLTDVVYTSNNTLDENVMDATENITTQLPDTSNYTIDWSKATNVSGALKNVYIINETFWYKNNSAYGKIELRIRGSDYGTSTSCDLVLFVPLISLIAAAAFCSLIVLFGRGREATSSWIIVYPVLIASAILTILSIIALVSMKNGIEDFCSKFEDYTGQSKCTRLISFFAFQRTLSTKQFWDNYVICYYTYMLALLLWIVQLVVTILRLGSLADFHFVTISVERVEIKNNEEFDEKIHNVLIKSGLKPIHRSLVKQDSNSTIEKNEISSTTC